MPDFFSSGEVAVSVTITLRLLIAVPLYSGTMVYSPTEFPLKVAVYVPAAPFSEMALSVAIPLAGALPLLSFIVNAKLFFMPVSALPCASFTTNVSVAVAALSAMIVFGLTVNTDSLASGVGVLIVTVAGDNAIPLTVGVRVTFSTSVPAVTTTVYTPADFLVSADTTALFSVLYFRLISFTSMSTG